MILSGGERRRYDEGLDAGSGLENIGGGAIAVQARLELLPIVRVVGRLIDHRQHFAGVDVDDDDRARVRAVLLHRRLQLPIGQVLDAQIDARHQIAPRPRRADALDVLDIASVQILNDALGAVIAVQQLIVAEFQPLLALVVDGGESDHVPRDFARRIVTPVFAQQIDPRNSQCLDVRRLIGRHVPHQVEEFAIEIAGDAPRQRLLILLQCLGEFRQLIDVVVQLLRVHPHAVDRRTDGERLAGAVRDRAAMRCDLDHAHGSVVALLGEKAVIEQLQLDRAQRKRGGRQHHQSEHHGRAPAIAVRLRCAFARSLLHGRTIRTSRVWGKFICSLALATRSTNACEDQ